METTVRPGSPAQRGTVQEWHVLQRALPATPVAARLARMTARVACRAWRVPAAEEPAALVVSELVTTVLRRTETTTLSLRVLMTPRRLRLEVHDPSGRLPEDLGAPGTDDVDALAVVAATAVRWGAERRAAGAQLWAEIAL
ncbi:MAG TPA: hypothetical protein VM433_04710 [Mycobacteriales bacterium]|nr:hypothetical protein [Mycobacteriales bacterium]